MSAQSALLAYALAYAVRGWPVVACHHPTTDGRCSCGRLDCEDVGKHPRYHHIDLPCGLHSATTDASLIQRWWTRWPQANIAIATGPGAGLLVADSDHPTLYRLPSPTVVATARGRHAYFAYPDILHTRSTRTGILAHLDVRGAGGMVIAPPSRHHSGHTYTWLESGPLAPPPSWLLTLLLAPSPARAKQTTPSSLPGQSNQRHQTHAQPIAALKPYGAAALAAELQTLRAAPVGKRNDTLNWVAFRAGQLARRGALTDSAQDLIAAVASALLLPSSEIERTLRSGWTAGWRAGERGRK